MQKETIENLIKTAQEELGYRFPEHAVKRDVTIEKIPKKITALIGMRRTGKTVMMYQDIQEKMSQHSSSQLLYINFEDDRYAELQTGDFGALIDAFYHLFPENHDRLCYLYFDEIQYVPQWPRVLRRILDTKKVALMVTGSSAKMLSTEIATALRGRSLATEVWPFSFTEYLTFQKIDKPSRIGKITQDKFSKQLKIYLREGGFPEVQGLSLENRSRILQDYVQVVLLRDIIERHRITNVAVLRHLIRTLLRNVGRRYTVNKWFQDFKSQGFTLGKSTLYDYLDYIQDAYLGFSVPLWSTSIKQQWINPKKFYAIDTGLVAVFAFDTEYELGHLFENMIYVELRRKRAEIFYYLTQSSKEVDFYVQYPDGKKELIQVCWDLSDPKTKQREESALTEAMDETGLSGRIITPQYYIEKGLSSAAS